MMLGNGQQQLSVPPGFRFHPTDEELLYYYLRKKVSYEAIDLDVIREVDLNKLEPWDLKEKCRIGSGPQNEWYFFSHKDKKYPTGSRTNRATTAGFWKATGRDKAIHLSNSSNKRIGMRKTLVFYTGRAPHGQKTDWIMHEYRLDDHHHHDQYNAQVVQEEGWVVCRVFEKKSTTTTHNRGGFHDQPEFAQDQEQHQYVAQDQDPMKVNAGCTMLEPKQNNFQALYDCHFGGGGSSSSSMHLPQLLSPDHHHQSAPLIPSFLSPISSFNTGDIQCSQNLLRLTSSSGGNCGGGAVLNHERTTFNGGDWSFLDRLLANSHHQNQLIMDDNQNKCHPSSSLVQALEHHAGTSAQRFGFAFQYLGNCEAADVLKFSK